MKPDPARLNHPEALNRSYDSPEVRLQREQTLSALAIRSGESILDIGCGTGFLTWELGMVCGPDGRVCAIDASEEMVEQAKDRCQSMTHVDIRVADASELPFDTASFDVATCTQVLLYVPDTELALSEMFRVLRPGSRVAVLETDWRGLVLNSGYPDITEKAILAWDGTVPSPNLPSRLAPLLRQAGFTDIEIVAIPLLNTNPTAGTFSYSTHNWLAKNAVRQGMISDREREAWQSDIDQRIADDDYFFSVNRYLFLADRP